MSLDKKLVADMVKITSNAAISCLKYLGKNDKQLIDKSRQKIDSSIKR